MGIFVSIAVFFRRMLKPRPKEIRPLRGVVRLSAEREALYRPLAQEVEVRSAILAITANDAFEEYEAGRMDCAWRLMDLVSGELTGLANLNSALNAVVSKYLPAVQFVVPLRHLDSKHFRSALMNEYSRLQEVLGQFVFPSKLRFQFHLRVLRQAADALVADLGSARSLAKESDSSFLDVWKRMEADLHDFDLVIKETMLALRVFLGGLDAAELGNLRVDLDAIPSHARRSTPLPSRTH